MPETKKAIEMCLCPTCASTFYNIPSYRIYRKNPYQCQKDVCTYCSSRLGYDFLISEMSNVRKPRCVANRTLESGAENE